MDSSNILFGDTFIGSKWFNPDYLFGKEVLFIKKVLGLHVVNTEQALNIYHSVLFFFALFFLCVMCYVAVRMLEIRKKEHDHLHHEIAEYAHHQAERAKKKEGAEASKNPQWVKTLEYLFSAHPSDWKLAVIEADSMLEALMTQLGFKGDTLGEKLKSATQESFHSLTQAWEAHTVRNKIAHEGAAFDLSQREAKRIIAIYEHIFRDFGYI